MEEVLGPILEGRHVEERRTLLEAAVHRAGDGPAETALALNEVVVNRGTSGGMIDTAVEIDGRFVYAMRSDGIIIATPTGSTAYALSAQGPIVDPQVPALLLVPVAPHALTNRPIAVGDAATIRVTLLRGSDAWAHCDGHAHFQLSEGDSVEIRRSAHLVRLLHPEGHDHFAMSLVSEAIGVTSSANLLYRARLSVASRTRAFADASLSFAGSRTTGPCANAAVAAKVANRPAKTDGRRRFIKSDLRVGGFIARSVSHRQYLTPIMTRTTTPRAAARASAAATMRPASSSAKM